ncbi:hypothetical protein GGI09_003250 [Coemansia sp. S100]|nr:hypothetical protein LPJ71_004573 [Coemansia sp. S17]KAJ2098556.1 hypothetical protein GGI09_003250 [Coemansia sp. S100]
MSDYIVQFIIENEFILEKEVNVDKVNIDDLRKMMANGLEGDYSHIAFDMNVKIGGDTYYEALTPELLQETKNIWEKYGRKVTYELLLKVKQYVTLTTMEDIGQRTIQEKVLFGEPILAHVPAHLNNPKAYKVVMAWDESGPKSLDISERLNESFYAILRKMANDDGRDVGNIRRVKDIKISATLVRSDYPHGHC